MVDVIQIPYNLASTAVRGVYDAAIDGASDLLDDTLDSAKNSLVSLIPTTLLNNNAPSSYVDVVPVPDVISDVLFGISNIPSKALDAASRAGRYVWDNIIPDIPGIDVEETVRSIVSGIYTYIFGEDEVGSVPTTGVSSSLVSGAEELARKVVAKTDGGSQAARITRLIIVQPGSPSSSAVTTSTSLSASTTESGRRGSIVISSIPPSADEVATASAVATVGTGEFKVVGSTTGTTASDGDGVKVSTEGSSTNVLQTILNFLTGTSPNTSSASASTQNSAATAQISGLGLLLGVGGNNGSARSTARTSSTVVPVVNTLSGRVVSALGGGERSLSLENFVLGIFNGDSEAPNITNIPSGLSIAQTLFYAAEGRTLGVNRSGVPHYQRSPWGEVTLRPVVELVLSHAPDSSKVPYSGNISSRVSLGHSDPSSSNLETGQVALGLADEINGIHLPTGANSDSGSEGGEHSAYETMRDLELALAQNLNIPSSQEPAFVDSSIIITRSNQASVAV